MPRRLALRRRPAERRYRESVLPDKPKSNAPVAFIDFEASGLGARSWPIEVGWAFGVGEPESMLIKPAPAWPLDVWDAKAETMHGLSLDVLAQKGRAPEFVCEALIAALDGYAVYSDAPDWDGFWMMRLFDAAGCKPSISLCDFGALMPALEPSAKSRLIQEADKSSPRRHRAADDVRHLQTLFRLAASLR